MEDLVKQFQEPLGLLLRWGHVLAAVTALSGLVFSRFALLPALEDVDEETRERIHSGVRRAWIKWVMGAIAVLILTGLANYLLTIQRASAEAWGGNGRAWMRFHGYHAFMGMKILFAFAVFYMASALIGRGEATQWARDDRKKWLTVTLGLALAVVIISGYLRQMHTGPNTIPRADDGERMEGGEGGDRRGMAGGAMMDDEFGGGGGFGGAGFGGMPGGGRGRGPRGGDAARTDAPPPDEGDPEPGADAPAAPAAGTDAPPTAPDAPPDEGTPEPGADAPAAAN